MVPIITKNILIKQNIKRFNGMFNRWSRFSLIVNWPHYNKSSILYYIDKTKRKIFNKIISESSKKAGIQNV